MLTRIIVVQPLFHVDLDDSTTTAKPVCGTVASAAADEPIYGANGQVLAFLSALLQQLAPMLLQILPLFIKTPANPSATA